MEMPRVRNVIIGGENVQNEVTMASGKVVAEVKGFRPTIKAEWDWLPAETIITLHALLRQGNMCYVQYPDPVDGDASGVFLVSYPETKIFTFTGAEPRWHGVSLTMTAQEVI